LEDNKMTREIIIEHFGQERPEPITITIPGKGTVRAENAVVYCSGLIENTLTDRIIKGQTMTLAIGNIIPTELARAHISLTDCIKESMAQMIKEHPQLKINAEGAKLILAGYLLKQLDK